MPQWRHSKIKVVEEWLRKFIAKNEGIADVVKIKEAASAVGFTDTHLARARNRIGAVSVKEKKFQGRTQWSLIDVETSESWLRSILKEGRGQILAEEVRQKALEAGYTLKSLRTAADRIGVEFIREGRFGGRTQWFHEEIRRQTAKAICNECGSQPEDKLPGETCGDTLDDNTRCASILSEILE